MYTITVSRSSLLTIRPYNVLGRTKYTNTITHRHEDVRDRPLPVTCKGVVLLAVRRGGPLKGQIARLYICILSQDHRIRLFTTSINCLANRAKTCQPVCVPLSDTVSWSTLQSLVLTTQYYYLFPPYTLSTGFLVFN